MPFTAASPTFLLTESTVSFAVSAAVFSANGLVVVKRRAFRAVVRVNLRGRVRVRKDMFAGEGVDCFGCR